MRLNDVEEPRLGGQRPFIHLLIQHLFIEHPLYVRLYLLQVWGMGETDNKPLHKTYACWIVISDMNIKIQEWGRDGKRGEKVTVGRVVKEVVSGLRPDKSQGGDNGKSCRTAAS